MRTRALWLSIPAFLCATSIAGFMGFKETADTFRRMVSEYRGETEIAIALCLIWWPLGFLAVKQFIRELTRNEVTLQFRWIPFVVGYLLTFGVATIYLTLVFRISSLPEDAQSFMFVGVYIPAVSGTLVAGLMESFFVSGRSEAGEKTTRA